MKHFITGLFVILCIKVSGQETPASPEDSIPIQRTAQKNAEELLKYSSTALTGSFEFTKSIPVKNSPLISREANQLIEIRRSNKITVLYEKDNDVYFMYWRFTDSTSAKLLNDQVFSLPKATFEAITKPMYRRYKGVSAGAYTVPFRLRAIGSSDFDFESSLSLQANLVFGFGTRYQKDSWLDASFGMGITGAYLTDKNSNVETGRTATAFTLSIGAVAKPTKFVNIGVFLGTDFLGKNDRDVNWKYNKKLWLGIGINVSLNEISTEKPAMGNN